MGEISQSESSVSQSISQETQTPKNWLYSFWKFSRPHTIIGTSLSVLSLYLITQASTTNPPHLLPPLGALLACLAGNVYIVGLNQLEDIEIDKINKPHLPVAAGEFSPKQGQIIVALTGILALGSCLFQGHFLLAMVAISLALGTAYSLPPIRLKRYPFWASFCIFTVRGVIVNLGLFLHFNWLLSHPTDTPLKLAPSLLNFSAFILPEIPAKIWLLTLFILGFTFAIAIFKDIPDIEGDRQYNINTFTIKLGAPVIFNLARWVLTFCYLGIILASLLWVPGINPIFVTLTHAIALAVMWWRSTSVNLQQKTDIAQYYQFIWKLFFLEYLLFPAACFLA